MHSYNAGHLIEAALAHYAYYKNNRLLEPIVKYVRLIHKTFGPNQDQLHGYPGHPEIELALLRLYDVTSSQEAYDLAKYFILERGNPRGQQGKHYFTWEAEQRRESPWTRPDTYPEKESYWYCQAHVPITRQPTIEGHSVRAVYLLTAVADFVRLAQVQGQMLAEPDDLRVALYRLWDNMVQKKMYVTGGIGAIKQWEGFAADYFLPQGTDDGGCYSETCAAIGVMMLAERLLSLDLDGRFADVMELCLYNSVMTAMSLDGGAFTYENQLASSESDKSARHGWFSCACCPPNMIRLFGSLGGYVWNYGQHGNGAFVNVFLYTTAKLDFEVNGETVSLSQTSTWPWSGTVHFELHSAVPVTIRLRLPGWSKGGFALSPPATVAAVEKGFITIDPEYMTSNGGAFSVTFGGFEPRYVAPHPYTNQRTLTAARGPVVYCVEDADNPWETNHFKDAAVRLDEPLAEEHAACGEESYVALRTRCWQRCTAEERRGTPHVEPGEVFRDPREIVFIPYYLRANRGGRGQMRVGLLHAL